MLDAIETITTLIRFKTIRGQNRYLCLPGNRNDKYELEKAECHYHGLSGISSRQLSMMGKGNIPKKYKDALGVPDKLVLKKDIIYLYPTPDAEYIIELTFIDRT